MISRESLREILILLHSATSPQVEYITRTIRKWGKDNRVSLQWWRNADPYYCEDDDVMWWVQEASSEMRTVVLFIVLTKVQTKISFLSVSPKLLLHPILRYHSPFPAKKDSDVPCFHLNETLSSPPSHTHHPLLYYLI